MGNSNLVKKDFSLSFRERRVLFLNKWKRLLDFELYKKEQNSFVTDLSAAGSPAELKHIIQRSEKKSTEIPRVAASKTGRARTE
jgi:hypothetical protein